MNVLFFLIFFVSIVLLIVGLIFPSAFNSTFRERATRKYLAKFFGASVIVSFVLFVVSSETRERRIDVKTQEVAVLSEEVKLELSVEISQQNSPSITGSTNLPDGTIIMTSISGLSSDFMGQDRTTVSNGRFHAGPFASEKGLPDGKYVAGATMPIPRLQYESVRAIIGDDGEYLSGVLVRQSDFGATVSAEHEFQIGEDSAARMAGQKYMNADIEANRILSELRKLVTEANDMESLRDRGDVERLKRCGERMRSNQAKAELLREQAMELPRALALDLSTAAYEMIRCVSCLPDALKRCEMATNTLNEAETVIADWKQ
jgi:hypothetical protein